ncbi:symmetrical bis(5'-nucleosyl)-tetraphosphatase [Halomonas vilamensis]|uniref:bis(5'-nucleosyl)-tetraphosphatase (symmetrical) n=1 Tax=Vreelandella vilamensis TaxID=531309 RepID=A0ABU1H7R2_9GAMM|nr:symmetrical bis(5'-nucleosyl)-tetraphosphatase [Halomonas vilamensis]MDR5899777.1 symmetrical bis(5'-nucleosyl)-tetraphosphatase [Halomonas vilamensis]
MSTYVIGDLHGCHKEFVALLETLAFNPDRDRLWLVGDLVNRGPGSLECLREARALGARCVLGNHDFHLLVAARGGGKLRKNDTLEDILNAPDRDALLDWLQQQPLTMREDDTLMVHAGILPSWSLTHAQALDEEVQAALQGHQAGAFLRDLFGDQPDRWRDDLEGMDRLRCIVNVMARMRFISANEQLDFAAKQGLDSAPEGFAPWFQYPRDDKARLLFGHWAALSGETPAAAIDVHALDTGCAWGGALTAMTLETGALTTMPSQRTGRTR